MASTELLDAYLALERLMLRLDAQSDPMADDIRDQMDPLWHRLDDSDIEYLNQRHDVEPSVQQPLCFTGDFYTSIGDILVNNERTGQGVVIQGRSVGLTFPGWEFAA